MLTHLQIRDFAIIDAAELEFGRGLTALTGETGAGKSILVDAVVLAIGGRAAADVVRHGAERAEISATFDLAGNAAACAWLEEQSLEHDGEVMLRRQVGADGRTRAYVNGQALPVTQVRALGELLLDIHGQQEFLTLTRPDTQRALLDAHGGHGALAEPVARLAREWRAVEAELAELTTLAAERDSRLELLRYQLKELEALNLEPGEPEALAAEAQRLANRGRLAEAAQAALALLYEGEGEDAYARAGRAGASLRNALELDARLRPVGALIEEALIPLREAGRELAAYLESLEVDPRRQEAVETRIASIEQLARKHRVAAAQLIDQLALLTRELEALERAGTTLTELEARRSVLAREYQRAAAVLSAARLKAAAELGRAVTALMRGLGMPGGTFAVEVSVPAAPPVDPNGVDRIEFLVSANPGQPPRPIARVASGGELSRISLAVQVAAAHQVGGATCMIFDEVDAGVGGAVAEMVGRELHALGRRGQVLCVTHLPQVASQADQHVRVAKLSDGRSSRTVLTALTADERVEELARMLAGVDVTATAREHAREMLAKPRAPAAARPAERRRRREP
ncbi:MAG TPA: DNA repair protein RecN [Steroidobacteraceae bacterium]|nr:DNA repair protein RecN [Steroidobacteraceae bacterium]